MDEQESKTRGKAAGLGRVIWLLIIVALVILYWWYRKKDTTTTVSEVTRGDLDATPTLGADPDDILVDLVDTTTPQTKSSIEKAFGIDLVLVDDTAAESKLYRAHVDPAKRDRLIAEIAKRSDVEVVEPDSLMSLSPEDMEPLRVEAPTTVEPGFPNDPLYVKQWNLRQIKMPEAWKLADGNGTIVAVLDTGVSHENWDKFHILPDLAGIKFVDPYNFVSNNKHAGDDHGHGNHVTGSIAQVTNNGIGVAGVARNVQIMPLKVLSKGGSGSVAGIADAIKYAADHKAKVINMSLGGPFPSKVLKNAVEYAHKKGVTVICAAGNDGKGKVGYPAAYPGAVAVAATQENEATTFYSNWGKDIDIAAPGGNTTDENGNRNRPDGGILQNTIVIGDPTKDGYYAFMGTSMASPHAAGVAALVVGEGVSKPDDVEAILKATARKPNGQQYNVEKYGAGIIDAQAAVLEARKAKKDAGSGTTHVILGILMAGAVAASAKRRAVKLGAGYLAGVIAGSAGLFSLPSIAPSIATLPATHALTFGNVMLFSALIPMALLTLGNGMTRLRPALVGLTVGIAASLAFFAVAPLMLDISAAWLVINSLICVALARIAIKN